MNKLNKPDKIDTMITDGYKSINFSESSKEKIRNRLLNNNNSNVDKKNPFFPIYVPIAITLCVIVAIIGYTLMKENDTSKVANNKETDDCNYLSGIVKVEPKYPNLDEMEIKKAEIIYCDQEYLIFRINYGLFIYSVGGNIISNSLDLKYINCDNDQGDNACKIETFANGRSIKLYNEKNTYHYNWQSNRLFKCPEEEVDDVDDKSYIKPAKDTKTNLTIYSTNYATVNDNKIYLSNSGNKIEDISYVVENKNGVLKNEKIFSSRQKDTPEVVYGTSNIYSKEDMNSAIELIKKRFIQWRISEVNKIEYAGDECNSKENISDMNVAAQQKNIKEELTQCIQFKCDFRSPESSINQTTFSDDQEYTNYSFWFGRSENGEWHLLSQGY